MDEEKRLKLFKHTMEISTKELNELLEKEFQRGRDSIQKTISTPDMTKLLIDDITNPYIPQACINCPNHPSNGGSGNCNCSLPIEIIY